MVASCVLVRYNRFTLVPVTAALWIFKRTFDGVAMNFSDKARFEDFRIHHTELHFVHTGAQTDFG